MSSVSLLSKLFTSFLRVNISQHETVTCKSFAELISQCYGLLVILGVIVLVVLRRRSHNRVELKSPSPEVASDRLTSVIFEGNLEPFVDLLVESGTLSSVPYPL